MTKISGAIIFIAIMLTTGCANNTIVKHIPSSPSGTPIKLAVFLDGTANSEGSYTNVSKLYNLTVLQERDDVRAGYIEGVGTNGKLIGMAMGWGIGKDVREAYRFLAENYKPNRADEIYIFGFSRGAYAARILSALVHVAGIPNVSHLDDDEADAYIEKIYTAFKIEDKSVDYRRGKVEAVIGYKPTSVKVEFMGLWDTVEALGWPDYEEDTGEPNSRYADQLCNIKKAAHAMSIDDDRAQIFTPILLTRDHLINECKEVNINEVVDEVWFSGAHSDVGGGYDDTDISGVSLNWMLGKLMSYKLVPNLAKVYSDFKDTTHDPREGFFSYIYRELSRSIDVYSENSSYNGGKLKVHRSVLDRLAQTPVKPFESHWFETDKYKACFKPTSNGLEYMQSEKCLIDVIS